MQKIVYFAEEFKNSMGEDFTIEGLKNSLKMLGKDSFELQVWSDDGSYRYILCVNDHTYSIEKHTCNDEPVIACFDCEPEKFEEMLNDMGRINVEDAEYEFDYEYDEVEKYNYEFDYDENDYRKMNFLKNTTVDIGFESDFCEYKNKDGSVTLKFKVFADFEEENGQCIPSDYIVVIKLNRKEFEKFRLGKQYYIDKKLSKLNNSLLEIFGFDFSKYASKVVALEEDLVSYTSYAYKRYFPEWFKDEEDGQMNINYKFGEVSFTADDDHLKVSICVTPVFTDCDGDIYNSNTEELIFVFNNYEEYDSSFDIIFKNTDKFIKDFMKMCWKAGCKYGYFEKEEFLLRNKLSKHIKECFEHAIEIGNLKNWVIEDKDVF